MYGVFRRPVVYILEGVRPLVDAASQRPVAISLRPSVLAQSLDRAWFVFKGVTAIVIASI
jgi:hypothetical protein